MLASKLGIRPSRIVEVLQGVARELPGDDTARRNGTKEVDL